MADPIHLAVIDKGVPVWNNWRLERPDVTPSLRGADLSSRHLPKIDFRGADLYGCNLSKSYLALADLDDAQLRKADLQYAALYAASFRNANLSKADLRHADLRLCQITNAKCTEANFSHAIMAQSNLTGSNLALAFLLNVDLNRTALDNCNLESAELGGSRLIGSSVNGANFENVGLGRTLFSGVDLSVVRNFTARHWAESMISYDTVISSRGRIPVKVLAEAGMPEEIIRLARRMATLEGQYFNCFISYAGADEQFARKLYEDLVRLGVRCWFAPEDIRTGDRIITALNQAIRDNDRVILVLSKVSLESVWVRREVEAALSEEMERKGTTIICPVRLDDHVFEVNTAWAREIRARHITNFGGWDKRFGFDYQSALSRLLRALAMDSAE